MFCKRQRQKAIETLIFAILATLIWKEGWSSSKASWCCAKLKRKFEKISRFVRWVEIHFFPMNFWHQIWESWSWVLKILNERCNNFSVCFCGYHFRFRAAAVVVVVVVGGGGGGGGAMSVLVPVLVIPWTFGWIVVTNIATGKRWCPNLLASKSMIICTYYFVHPENMYIFLHIYI